MDNEITPEYSIVTNIYDNPINLQTIQQDVPQLQTVIQEGVAPITTILDAPFVEVTSVNGMTGDVIVEIVLSDFQTNYFYKKGTAVLYNGGLYYAKADFTSDNTFSPSDWDTPTFVQEQADWAESDNTKNSYIKNKPALATVATSGAYGDLSGTPNLATVATSGAYSDLTGTPNLATVATSGAYSDLSNTPTIDSTLSASTNAIQNTAVNTEFGKVAYVGTTLSTPSNVAYVANVNIQDGAVTPAKISTSTYSTTEQVTGTWIDGKPIYRKVLTQTATSSGAFSIDLGNFRIETLLSLQGYMHVNNGTSDAKVPTFYTSATDYFKCFTRYYVSSGTPTSWEVLEVRAGSTNTANNPDYYFIVEYTKSS